MQINLEDVCRDIATDLETAPRFAGVEYECNLDGVEYTLLISLTRKGEPTMRELLGEAEAK